MIGKETVGRLIMTVSKMHIQVSKIANQSRGTSRHKVFCGNLTEVSQVTALK